MTSEPRFQYGGRKANPPLPQLKGSSSFRQSIPSCAARHPKKGPDTTFRTFPRPLTICLFWGGERAAVVETGSNMSLGFQRIIDPCISNVLVESQRKAGMAEKASQQILLTLYGESCAPRPVCEIAKIDGGIVG